MKIKIAIMAIICTCSFNSCMYNDIVSEYNSQKNNKSVAETTVVTDNMPVTENSESELPKETVNNNQTLIEDDSPGIKYDQLNDEEKAAYKQLSEGINNYDSCVLLDNPIMYDSIVKVFYAVYSTLECQMYNPIRENCSLTKKGKDMVCTFVLQYNISKEEMEKEKSELEQESEKILNLLTDEMTETEKEMVLHDELIKKCRYDTDAISGSQEEFQKIASSTHCADAYGAIVEGKAVCEGYSRAFRYLCNKAGIKCELVSGKASGGMDHMWNMVYVDGAWHQVDVTHDDPLYTIEGKESVEHTYFNLSDEEMFRDHTIDEESFLFPRCE